MRTVIVLIMSAAMALAQQAARPSQQLAAGQDGLQQLAVLQAQIAARKADETLSQMKLLESLKTYQESHPHVVALRRKLDQLHAQEDEAVRRLNASSEVVEADQRRAPDQSRPMVEEPRYRAVSGTDGGPAEENG